MKTFPILESDRLTLRQLTISDNQQIFLLRSDKKINKYLERQKAETVKDASVFINKIIQSQALYWAITLNKKNQTIGTICLFDFSDDYSSCEIGFELLNRFQGQGYMKESIQLVVNYAFTIVGINNMIATVHKDNKNSIKLLEKLSFKVSSESNNLNALFLNFNFKDFILST